MRYRFENFMAKGGISIFISLFVLFILCLVIAVLLRGILILIFPENDMIGNGFEHIWAIFLMMTDPGNMGIDMGSSGWVRISAVFAGMLGVIIFSMLIAFITTQVEIMLDDLKKGHSRVIEENQTLILGWNERIIDIIRELIIANESEEDAVIVVLADREKEEMDYDIASHISDTKSTRIITRSGTTSSITMLKRVRASKARSAIILGACTEGDSEEEKRVSDAKVIKTILALIGCQKDRNAENGGTEATGEVSDNRINIVAEIFFRENRELLATFESGLINSVDSWDILGRILVQTSRTSGLAVVYNEILSFDGCELYFTAIPASAAGKTFSEIKYHYSDGIPMGLRKNEGLFGLRPSPDTILEAGDELLLIAEDDSTITFSQDPITQPSDHPFTMRRLDSSTERELILGWHSVTPTIIREYAGYLPDGSVIDIVIRDPAPHIIQDVEELNEAHPELAISVLHSDPMTLTGLSSLRPFTYDNIIILSQNEGDISAERIDSETLFILLLLRKILKDRGITERQTKLITQVLNSENQELITQTNVDDFLISNKMISMIFAQLSEESTMKTVYANLFEETGSEIYLKPADLYFNSLPMDLPFADLMGAATKRNEICIGYRVGSRADDPKSNFGIILNPSKTASIHLAKDDFLVVLAEDEY